MERKMSSVEALLAHQHLVDLAEEHARLGALDDAVVVGGGERDDLRDAEVGERGRVGALPLGGIPERADTDDEALARHETGDRLDRADRAGVREADGDPGEVVGRQLIGLG
jgi:hypothetical protein